MHIPTSSELSAVAASRRKAKLRNRHDQESRDSALIAARNYIQDGIDKYEYDRAKSEAATWLFLGDLSKAIYSTQVCLFLVRLRRAMQ